MKISTIVFLSRSNCSIVAETGKRLLKNKKENKQGKKRYSKMGLGSNSMEMPRLFFSEEAGFKSTQRTFDCIYLFVTNGRFFIATFICELIFFSYKTQP